MIFSKFLPHKRLFLLIEMGVILLFFIFIFMTMSFSSAKKRVNTMLISVESIVAQNKGCFPKEKERALSMQIKRLSEVFGELDSEFFYIEDFDLSKVKSPGLYFMEQLSKLKKEFAQYIHSNSLPENLGFPRQMPSSSQVPCLIRALQIERGFLTLLQGLKDITVSNMLIEIKDGGDFASCVVKITVLSEFEDSFTLLKKILLAPNSLSLVGMVSSATDNDDLVKSEFVFKPIKKDIWEKTANKKDRDEVQ